MANRNSRQHLVCYNCCWVTLRVTLLFVTLVCVESLTPSRSSGWIRTSAEDTFDGHQRPLRRDSDQSYRYQFGIGKRSRYQFGLGKRANFDDDRLARGVEVSDGRFDHDRSLFAYGLGPQFEDSDFDHEKRDRYAFGLGKRAEGFDPEKRDRYAFGLGKRVEGFDPEKRDRYAFGLGKRLEGFDLDTGKRDRYAFGLGKRLGSSANAPLTEIDKRGNSKEDDSIKRNSNRYSFGIGKKR